MDAKRGQRLKSNENTIVETGHCPKCSTSFKIVKKPNSPNSGKSEPDKVAGSPDCGYVMQIVCVGVWTDGVYEAQIALAPDVDMSSIKITVKGNNLRVTLCEPLDEQYASHLSEIGDKSSISGIIKKMRKHCENLMIPDGIDSAKVRAVVDNNNRMLVLTAPPMKASKARKYMLRS